jgi:hypothetical protein
MEDWKGGILGLGKGISLGFSLPSFHHSNIPIFPVFSSLP